MIAVHMERIFPLFQGFQNNNQGGLSATTGRKTAEKLITERKWGYSDMGQNEKGKTRCFWEEEKGISKKSLRLN